MAGYTLTSINKLRLTNEDRESWYADYIRNMNIIDGKLLSANAVTNSMLAADAVEDENVAAGAAIQRSKLASGSADHVVINNASGVMTSEATLSKTRGGTGADNSSVTFPSSGTIVTRTATETLTNKTIDGDDNTLQDISITSLKTVLADANKVILRDASGVVSSALLANVNVSGSAAIAYSKLNLSGSILNADINASAAIARSKLASGTAAHVIVNDGSGVLSSEARLSLDRTADGTNHYVLVASGAGTNPAYALLLDNNIDVAAAIARTKIANGTADHVVINNGSGTLSSEAQLSVSRGGTGLSALGTANQVLGVNNAANAAEYKTITSGTSGTDFAVAHSANTITLDLPTASASNRGALSTSDWSTFNAKIGGSGTNGQVALFSGTGTITSNASIAYATGADTNNISLTSGIKIGANASAAASAGSGAIRYNSGNLEYSDGAAWLTLGLSGGISSLNSLTAGAQSFANDTNVTISSATSTHTIGWSGQLSIARGGTGLSSLGTANQILGVNSGASAAEYKTLSVGTSGTDFAIAHSAGGVAFNLPDAGASARGVVTTGTQTLAGVKTFSSNAVFSSYVTLGDIISRDNSDGSVSVSSGQTLWHPNLDIQTGHTYSIAGQMVLVDELTGAGTVDGDGTVFDTSTDLTGYSRLDRNESVTGGKTFSQRIEALGGINASGLITANSGLSLTGSNILSCLNFRSTGQGLWRNTTNNDLLQFWGGSANGVSAGAGINAWGNTSATPGALRLYAGDVAGGDITFYTGNAIAALTLSRTSQTATFTGQIIASPVGSAPVLGAAATPNICPGDAGDTGFYGSGSNAIAIVNGGTINSIFTSSGNLAFANGGGIDFGATSNASGMSSEILSDYEEFTWTPTILYSGGAGDSSITYSVGTGTKVGNRVFVNFVIRFNKNTTGSGTITMGGFPFTSNSTSNYENSNCFSQYNNITFPANATGMVINLPNNSTTADLYFTLSTATALQALNATNCSATSNIIRGQLMYII